jgi:hypothetical protein
MWIEGILRSHTCSGNHSVFYTVISAPPGFAEWFGMCDEALPRRSVVEPLFSLVFIRINLLPKLPLQLATLRMPWIRVLPIGRNQRCFGLRTWSLCFGGHWAPFTKNRTRSKDSVYALWFTQGTRLLNSRGDLRRGYRHHPVHPVGDRVAGAPVAVEVPGQRLVGGARQAQARSGGSMRALRWR